MAIEVLIFGAGAIGAFYGSRLAKNANVNVSCICRSNFNAVRSNGFLISSTQYGEQKWIPTRVFPSPDEARRTCIKWDFIVVSTKALPDVTDDSELLEGLVPDDSAIVLIQNGIGVEEPYAKRFPRASILSAVTIASAAQPKHGHIQHNRWTRINAGPYIRSFGSPPSSSPSSDQDATDQADKFVSLLTSSSAAVTDASAYTHAKMQLLRWHKVAINAAMNPSSVLSGCTPNGTMSHDPDLSSHLLGVMHEILRTAPLVIGEPLPHDFATPEQIVKSTRKNDSGSLPSMAIDWTNGSTMEIEVILGNPIRLARAKGLEMPRTETLYALIKMLQKNRHQHSGEFRSSESSTGGRAVNKL